MLDAKIERFAAPETREYWRAAAEGPLVLDGRWYRGMSYSAYWHAASQGRLLLQKCLDCGAVQFYPRIGCLSCGSSHLGWVQASGRGKVFSFTVIHRAPKPELLSKVPYVLALVQLDEGVRMMSNIVECDPESVRIDMPVRVVFEPGSLGVVLPQFRPE